MELDQKIFSWNWFIWYHEFFGLDFFNFLALCTVNADDIFWQYAHCQNIFFYLERYRELFCKMIIPSFLMSSIAKVSQWAKTQKKSISNVCLGGYTIISKTKINVVWIFFYTPGPFGHPPFEKVNSTFVQQKWD